MRKSLEALRADVLGAVLVGAVQVLEGHADASTNLENLKKQ